MRAISATWVGDTAPLGDSGCGVSGGNDESAEPEEYEEAEEVEAEEG